jgi:polyisoprenoid-binding protein YceI
MRAFTKASFLAITALATVAATTADQPPMAWNVDASHTEINFSVKHFFTPVTGSFQDFDIDLVYDTDDFSNTQVSVRIAVESVSTGNEKRDNHLRSGDFFAADEHPYITFESTRVKDLTATGFTAVGDLTIKGVSHTVELPVTLLGVKDIPEEMRGMLGGVTQVASFQTDLTIDRTDYGVGVGDWAAALVVGHDVGITIAVEANRS